MADITRDGKMILSGQQKRVTPPLVSGNINLRSRPHVKNPDGSISTVRTISFEDNGKEILIPTVVGNRVVSDKEAIDHYYKTGEHLGIFNDPESATAYAQKLHNDYAAGMYDGPNNGLGGPGSGGLPAGAARLLGGQR